MTIIKRLENCRDTNITALENAHDYYENTKYAWRIVQQLISRGETIEVTNQLTGNQFDEEQLSGIAQKYVTGYLTSATFQEFVSIFERFFMDIVRIWLTRYPESLRGDKVQFADVLDATGKAEIVANVIDKKLLSIAYDRIANWFAYLNRLANLGCPTNEQIEKLTEIKVSRDVIVHNDGIINAIYIAKANGRARFDEGDTSTLPEDDHRESWELIKQVIQDISEAAIKKFK